MNREQVPHSVKKTPEPSSGPTVDGVAVADGLQVHSIEEEHQMANDRWRDDDRNRWGEDDRNRGRDYNRGDYGQSGYGRGYGQGERTSQLRDYGRNDDNPDYGHFAGERGGSSRDNERGRYGGGYEGGYFGSNFGRETDDRGGYGSYGGYGERGAPGYGREDRSGDYCRGYEGYGGGRDRNWMDRAGDEVSSWFGDENAERRRRMDQQQRGGHYGRGPQGYTRSDERIREDVNDRLTDDWQVDASNITLEVSKGEVTLNGTVDSRDAKRRAEDLAENCSGVKHVQNNTRVQQSAYFASPMTNDSSTDTADTKSSQ